MRAPLSDADLMGPELVLSARPAQVAVQSSLVRSSGCTASHVFFFSIALGTAGAAYKRGEGGTGQRA